MGINTIDAPDNSIQTKTISLLRDIDWLEKLFRSRISERFGGGSYFNWKDAAPDLCREDDYGRFIEEHKCTEEERLLMSLGLAPHIRPDLLDHILREELPQQGDFPLLGGVRGKNFRGFIPTAETALFLMAGDDFVKRIEIQKLFQEDHFLAKNQILRLEEPPVGEPSMSGKLLMGQEWVELFSLGKVSRPRFGINFPAQPISTAMDWDDLVLDAETMQQVKDLEMWGKYGEKLLNEWGMGKKIKPGYRVLFHGPPGTGKTLTASLIGKYTNREVYKIDLSMVVSKFIGETEKNLASLFDKAENKGWILFFDEADALFGKRTSVKDAHDKYANQEVSYLLQRTESYNGLVILATNFKNNIDDAFTRRFQSHIYFPSQKLL